MKNIISTLLLSAAASLSGYAQQANEAISYYLPTTAVHVNVIIEKTNYTPGLLAEYAQRYMRLDNVSLDAYTTYRIIATNMYTTAEPDTAKLFTLEIDKNHFINNVSKTEKGLLLAINGEGKDNTVIPTFTPSKPQPVLNPKDFMSQDILSATSSAKMAELTANEIFEIRDSRTQLARGEADFMPKDGTQLKLMMSQLDTQEKALMQVFSGVTTKDTTMTTITYLPTSEVEKQPLFRFSKYYGIVDNDDLSGSPYYIKVAKKKTFNDEPAVADNKKGKKEKKDKNDIGLRVNIPAKMDITIFNGTGNTLAKEQFQAPQFGKLENLSGELFGKKQSSRLILNPQTGAISKIEALNIAK